MKRSSEFLARLLVTMKAKKIHPQWKVPTPEELQRSAESKQGTAADVCLEAICLLKNISIVFRVAENGAQCNIIVRGDGDVGFFVASSINIRSNV